MSAPLPASVAPESRVSSAGSRYLLRLRLWAERSPAAVARLREQVAEERRGRFVLPGAGGRPLFAGAPPRWNENATPSADKEWIWELNRHLHWPRLLRVAALDGDESLRAQVLGEWLDWIERCPAPAWEDDEGSIRAAFDAPTPWRTLEVGIRMERSWPEAWEALANESSPSPAVRARILGSVREHGRVLAAIPPRLWPNADHNHYLSENAGLLRLALEFSGLPEAAAWREQAWREIGRCIEAQFTPDGGHIEGCPHYHAVSLRTVAGVLLFGRRHGLLPADAWRARLEGALAYALHSLRPTGVNVPWGDSDATAEGPACAALLAACALERFDELPWLRELIGPEAWSAAVADSLWFVPEPSEWLRRLEGLRAPAAGAASAPPLAHRQRQLGQAMFRNAWTRQAASVFFACRTPVNNGHAHIDPAGFDYCAFGRALVVDPGRYTYREGADRHAFKSAAYHNTVTIDGRDPFAYLGTWEFGPQRAGDVVECGAGGGWRRARGEQHNFAPATHRRTVALHEESGALIVVDEFFGLRPEQTVQIWLHLDSTRVALERRRAETHDNGAANVLVVGDAALALTALPGLVSDRMDEARASVRIRFSDTGGPAERRYVTRLLPRPAGASAWSEFPPAPAAPDLV
jgi:hypothetical protein